MAGTIDDLVKLYKDSFSIDKLTIISDNVKIFKQSQGRMIFFDDINRMIHSIEVNTDGNNFGVQNMFHFESFMYDQIQFMGNWGGPDQLKSMLDMLQKQGCIDATKRKDIIKYFQDQFSFANGYGFSPYTKEPGKDGINDNNYPVDGEGNVLTPTNSISINSIEPEFNPDQKI